MKMIPIQNIKSFLLVSIILCSLQKNYSQDENFWSHVRVGGNIGIGFSDNSFSAIVAPAAIYDFNHLFSAGLGLNLGYTDGQNFTATNYGASIITLYNPFPGLQLSAEFEETGVSRSFDLNGANFNEDYWYPALFIGVGYRVGFVSIGLRYDTLYDENTSIYTSAYAPFVRIFF